MLNAMRSRARRALRAAGGLLALAVLLTGAGWQARAADEPAPKAKSDANKADAAKKDEGRAAGRGADSDLQHQIDQLRREVEELRRNMERGARAFPVPPNFPGAPNFPSPDMMFGRMPHGRLGVIVGPVGETLADQLNLKKGEGLVVMEVRPDSAAAKAGLKAHDVLVEMNGKAVPDNVREFAQMVGQMKANTPMDVVVVRKGKQETLKGLSLPEGAEPRFPAPPGAPPAPRFGAPNIQGD